MPFISYIRPTKRPLTLVDAYNRYHLATGGIGNAMKASHADYNGHNYQMARAGMGSDRRALPWVVTYTWAGINRVGSSYDFRQAAELAVRKLDSGIARGGDVKIEFWDEEPSTEMLAVLAELGFTLQPAGEHRHIFNSSDDWRFAKLEDVLKSWEKMGFMEAFSILTKSETPEAFDASMKGLMDERRAILRNPFPAHS